MQSSIKKYILDTLTLFKGSSTAQIIPLFAIPFITRLYGTETIGQFAIIYAIATIFGTIAGFKLEFALVPADDSDRSTLFALLLILMIPMVLLLSSMFVLTVSIIDLERFKFSMTSMGYLAVLAMLTGLVNSANFYNSSLQNFKRIANAKITLAASTFILQIALGYIFEASLEMLLMSRIFSLAVSFVMLSSDIEWKAIRAATINKMFVILKKQLSYIFYFWPASIIDVVAKQVPILLIGGLYGDSFAGYYSMAERVLSVPTAAISSAVSQSFYQKFVSDLKVKANPRRILLFTWKMIGGIGAIPFLLLFIYSQELIAIVLGAEWLTSAEIIRVLLPMTYIAFISASTSSAMIALDGQKYSLYFTIFALFNKAGGIYYGYQLGDLMLGLQIMVVLQILQNLLYNFVILWKLKKRVA